MSVIIEVLEHDHFWSYTDWAYGPTPLVEMQLDEDKISYITIKYSTVKYLKVWLGNTRKVM